MRKSVQYIQVVNNLIVYFVGWPPNQPQVKGGKMLYNTNEFSSYFI